MKSCHPRRVSLYANKLLHATSERDIYRLEFADRNAAPSLVTRSFIAIERTSRNTPPSLCRCDKSHREREQNQKRHGTSWKHYAQHDDRGLEATWTGGEGEGEGEEERRRK